MGGLLNVLIVEDSEDDAFLLSRELQRGGFEVRFERVESAAAMKRALDSGTWEIILSDHAMPGFRSTDAIELLKQSNLNIPFIIVSGSIGEEVAVAAMKAGAYDYFLKGNIGRLVPAVEKALRENRERRELAKVQGELEKLHTRYATILRNTNDVYWEYDISSGGMWFNENMRLLFGHEPDAISATRSWFFEHIHPEDRTKIENLLDSAIASHTAQVIAEYRFRRADGSHAFIYDRPHIVFGKEGKPAVITGAMVDISEKKVLEERFVQSQKMEAFGQLAGGVAHDFNNLLTIILGYCDTLLSAAPTDDRSVAQLKTIKKAGERAADLTHQLLAFSRKQVVAPKVLNLNSVAVETKKLLDRLIGEDIEVVTFFEPALDCVKADPGQIQQLIMNLAVNARDAMPKGGRLTIETRNVELGGPVTQMNPDMRPGRYVVLSIGDTGCGMDLATKNRVFEPFFTTKDVGKGTGLGLATVHGIVAAADGTIELESKVGQGSTFKIYLPSLDHRPTEIIAEPEQPRVIPGGTETVFLVEDEKEIRTLSKDVLESCGYTVMVAGSGDEAMHMIRDHVGTIALLLTDVVMPGMNGRDLAEQMSIVQKGIRILYVSGYTDDAVIRNGVLEDKVHFLKKPYTPMSLGKKVREVLDRK